MTYVQRKALIISVQLSDLSQSKHSWVTITQIKIYTIISTSETSLCLFQIAPSTLLSKGNCQEKFQYHILILSDSELAIYTYIYIYRVWLPLLFIMLCIVVLVNFHCCIVVYHMSIPHIILRLLDIWVVSSFYFYD